MITRSKDSLILSLLILDFNCGIVEDHLSSMKILDPERVSIASPIFEKSSESRFHLVILYIGILACIERILSTICSDPISRENIATDFFCSTAIFSRILIAKAVFPILGRAARMINSPGLKPQSKSSNPS